MHNQELELVDFEERVKQGNMSVTQCQNFMDSFTRKGSSSRNVVELTSSLDIMKKGNHPVAKKFISNFTVTRNQEKFLKENKEEVGNVSLLYKYRSSFNTKSNVSTDANPAVFLLELAKGIGQNIFGAKHTNTRDEIGDLMVALDSVMDVLDELQDFILEGCEAMGEADRWNARVMKIFRTASTKLNKHQSELVAEHSKSDSQFDAEESLLFKDVMKEAMLVTDDKKRTKMINDYNKAEAHRKAERKRKLSLYQQKVKALEVAAMGRVKRQQRTATNAQNAVPLAEQKANIPKRFKRSEGGAMQDALAQRDKQRVSNLAES